MKLRLHKHPKAISKTIQVKGNSKFIKIRNNHFSVLNFHYSEGGSPKNILISSGETVKIEGLSREDVSKHMLLSGQLEIVESGQDQFETAEIQVINVVVENVETDDNDNLMFNGDGNMLDENGAPIVALLSPIFCEDGSEVDENGTLVNIIPKAIGIGSLTDPCNCNFSGLLASDLKLSPMYLTISQNNVRQAFLPISEITNYMVSDNSIFINEQNHSTLKLSFVDDIERNIAFNKIKTLIKFTTK